MHKLVNALMSWSLWLPAARLMRQVTFPLKMVIIATAVSVSLVWLLWVMVAGKLQGIESTAQELAGVRYASAIYPAMELAGVWRQQSRNAAFGEGGDQLPQARQAFDAAFKKLETVDAEVGQSLKVSSSLAALRSAVQAAQAVQPAPGAKADPEAVYQAAQVGQLINDGRYTQAEDALAPNTPFTAATNDVVKVLSAAKRLGFV